MKNILKFTLAGFVAYKIGHAIGYIVTLIALDGRYVFKKH